VKNYTIPIIIVVAITISGGTFLLLRRNGAEETNGIEQPLDANTVVIQNYEFSPSVIRIKQGDTVTWTNRDSVQHNVAHNSFESPLLRRGETYQYTFNAPGTYEYHCSPHPYMVGTVIVEEV
jgi:amicyanin